MKGERNMASKERAKENLTFNTLWQRFGTFGILILLLAILAVARPGHFFSVSTVTQILAQSSVNILIALGEFFAILIAGIDLSVGSVVALTGMVTAQLMVAGVNPLLSLVLGVLLGGVLGLINGVLVNRTGLHPFIITLGTQAILRGVTLIISNSSAVFGFPASFTRTISVNVFGLVPLVAIIALLTAVVLSFLTRQTKLGRNILRARRQPRSGMVRGHQCKAAYLDRVYDFGALRGPCGRGAARARRLRGACGGDRL